MVESIKYEIIIDFRSDALWPLRLIDITLMGKNIVEWQINFLKGYKIRRILIVHNENIEVNVDWCDIKILHKIDDAFNESSEAIVLYPFVYSIPIALEKLIKKKANIVIDEKTGKILSITPAKRTQITPKKPLKFPWQIFNIMEFMLTRIRGTFIHEDAKVNSSAKIEGNVYIDKGAKISRDAKVVGPAYLGENVFVGDNALIRGSIIERNTIIGCNMEVARSLFCERVETHSGYVGDSIVSKGVHFGAGFITGNVRLDRKTIKVFVPALKRKIDTGRTKLGAIIGRNANFGIHTGTMPGVLIGENAVIGPGTLIFHNVSDNVRIYRYESPMFRI